MILFLIIYMIIAILVALKAARSLTSVIYTTRKPAFTEGQVILVSMFWPLWFAWMLLIAIFAADWEDYQT